MSSDISYKVGETTNTIKASDWKNNIATAEINLKHDQTITFTNLPFGVTYKITEADYIKDKGGYTPQSIRIQILIKQLIKLLRM